MKEFRIENLESIEKCAGEFIRYVSQSPEIKSGVFAFYGAMGAGKTTFITALCKVLGVNDIVNSPTFTIVNEYRSARGIPIYHFDFYRINTPAEAMDIGFYDYVDSGNLCLIEWPENIESLLPEETLAVKISVNSDGSRTVSWSEADTEA